MKNFFELKGESIVITGGGGVLCGAIARALAGAGAKIAVLDLVEQAARKVTEEISAEGGTAIAAGGTYVSELFEKHSRKCDCARVFPHRAKSLPPH